MTSDRKATAATPRPDSGDGAPPGRRSADGRAGSARAGHAGPRAGLDRMAAPESDGVVLVIGQLDDLEGDGPRYASGRRLVFADYGDLSAELMARLAPSMVLSSVITPLFDAFDVAQSLHALGYDGPYRALTPRLPDPNLVRREVASCAPGLDFELLVVDADEPSAGPH